MKTEMMAANLHGIGDLRYETVPVPVCGEDEVLVAVKYCGICGSDVARVLTKGTYHFPTIPGHEFSGVVEYDPRGELTGRRVCVYPLLPCGKCEMCQEKTYELCENYDYYGSRRDGGFAEYLAVKRWNLEFLPDGVSLEEGAMCEPVSVAHHAVSRLQVRPGDSVLVSGAGPIGLLVAQWCKAYGAEKVYLFDVVKEKMDFANRLGFLEYRDDITVDAALEGTGYANALTRCLGAVKRHGHMVLMGNPAREMTLTQHAYWHILRKELYITGTWNSSFSPERNDWVSSLEAMASGKLQVKSLISHVYPLSRINDAFAMLKERKEFSNRVMIAIEE